MSTNSTNSFFVVASSGFFGASTLVFSSHSTLAAAKRAARGGQCEVRRGSLAKGERYYSSDAAVYPVAR